MRNFCVLILSLFLLAAPLRAAETGSGDCIVRTGSSSGTAKCQTGRIADSNLYDSAAVLDNYTIVPSVSGNALTVALKTKAGSDATSTDKIRVGMRSATATSGTYNLRSITAASSIVVPSSTTIGTANATQARIFVYVLDNAGTLEPALSLSPFSESVLQTSTAVSGGSSAYLLYSTTARSNVGVRLLGELWVTETTAGTWATAPSVVGTFSSLPTRCQTQTFTSNGTWVAPAGLPFADACGHGGGGGGGGGEYTPGRGGQGGGGATTVCRRVAVVPGTSYPVTIGPGGTAGAGSSSSATAGGTGGTTSLGSLALFAGATGGTSGDNDQTLVTIYSTSGLPTGAGGHGGISQGTGGVAGRAGQPSVLGNGGAAGGAGANGGGGGGGGAGDNDGGAGGLGGTSCAAGSAGNDGSGGGGGGASVSGSGCAGNGAVGGAGKLVMNWCL